MCIDFPGRVLDVDDLGATVLREGRARRASTLLVPDVVPGDWVLVGAGTILRRLEPHEAELLTTTLREAISRDALAAGRAAAATGGSR